MSIRRLCIIGVGLIGGSLARALKRAGHAGEVVGCGRDAAHLQCGIELGVIDRFETDPARAVEGADMVVVAVPLGAMRGVFERIRGHLAEDAVLTDVGSAKGSVVEDARSVFGEAPPFLVPGHPIAGTEKSGVEASFAELFEQRRVIVTPLPQNPAAMVGRVREMWLATGAEVVEMAVEHHDEVLAATSHLPHVLAYTLVDNLSRSPLGDEIFRFAAGGFRDFTRIASSDPGMWRDICMANREALLLVLERFGADLDRLIEGLTSGDDARLLATFENAKRARDAHCGP